MGMEGKGIEGEEVRGVAEGINVVKVGEAMGEKGVGGGGERADRGDFALEVEADEEATDEDGVRGKERVVSHS